MVEFIGVGGVVEGLVSYIILTSGSGAVAFD